MQKKVPEQTLNVTVCTPVAILGPHQDSTYKIIYVDTEVTLWHSTPCLLCPHLQWSAVYYKEEIRYAGISHKLWFPPTGVYGVPWECPKPTRIVILLVK